MYAWARTDNRSLTHYCYRDERNVQAKEQVLSRISAERLYQLTGVQIITLNTLYQLHADRAAEQKLPWVNLPEFLLHQLGGKRVSEYTNATHTQLLEVRDQTWCPEIFLAAGLDAERRAAVGEARNRISAGCRASWLPCRHFAIPA